MLLLSFPLNFAVCSPCFLFVFSLLEAPTEKKIFGNRLLEGRKPVSVHLLPCEIFPVVSERVENAIVLHSQKRKGGAGDRCGYADAMQHARKKKISWLG